MDWMGFDWDGDGYVEFEESMMTFAAFRIMLLQRENQLLHRQLEDIDNLDDSSFVLPIGWSYSTSDHQRGSGSGIVFDRIMETIGYSLGRLLRSLLSLLVAVVREWKLIFEIAVINFEHFSKTSKFTKYQRIILTLLLTFTLIITVTILFLIVLLYVDIN